MFTKCLHSCFKNNAVTWILYKYTIFIISLFMDWIMLYMLVTCAIYKKQTLLVLWFMNLLFAFCMQWIYNSLLESFCAHLCAKFCKCTRDQNSLKKAHYQYLGWLKTGISCWEVQCRLGVLIQFEWKLLVSFGWPKSIVYFIYLMSDWTLVSLC